jgi:hypothetical protein
MCPRGKASRHSQDLDSFRSCFAQNAATFVDCRAGGIDIVDKQNFCAHNAAWLCQRKSIAQIVSPFFAAQERLSSRTMANEQSRCGLVAPLRQTLSGNDQRLVESSCPQSVVMQGDRQDQIRFTEGGKKSIMPEQCSQGGETIEVAGEFERQDKV